MLILRILLYVINAGGALLAADRAFYYLTMDSPEAASSPLMQFAFHTVCIVLVWRFLRERATR